MKKIYYLNLCLASFIMLSCGKNDISPDNKTNDEKSNEISKEIISSDEIINSTVVEESKSVSQEVTSSSENIIIEDYVFDDSLFENKNLVLAVGDKYNIPSICTKEDFYWIEIDSDDHDVLFFDIDNNLIAKKEGKATAIIKVDDEFYDTIDVEIKGNDYMSDKFVLDVPNLINKTFTVFGDSISDVSVTAYEQNRPTFWCEMLVKRLNMTMHNYAKSGSTCGFTRELHDKYPTLDICATTQVNLNAAKEAVINSDYVFIYIGNNDVTYGVNIGNYDDINDENRLSYESFKGSFSYLINKIKEYNPNVKIVVLGPSYSTWGIGDYSAKNTYPDYTRAKSRYELSDIVNEIADYHKVKFVKLIDLWNKDNYKSYIPDGIHPQTAGYELIINRILGN